MELVIILAVVFGFALIRTGIEHKTKEREQKLQALQQALQNPSLDRATITALTHQLAGTKPPKEPRGAGRAMAWLLALGWLTLFSGLGIWVLGEITVCSDVSAAGLLVSLIGFGLVTYPFALRELESRRQES